MPDPVTQTDFVSTLPIPRISKQPDGEIKLPSPPPVIEFLAEPVYTTDGSKRRYLVKTSFTNGIPTETSIFETTNSSCGQFLGNLTDLDKQHPNIVGVKKPTSSATEEIKSSDLYKVLISNRDKGRIKNGARKQ